LNGITCSLASDAIQMSPGMTLRARAWMLDAVLDVYSHPQLVNTNRDETEIRHEYVKKMFKSCE
jgi:hypothetical protein